MAAMDTWNLTDLDVEPHHPRVLRSDEGAARAIAIRLPAGEELQDHETYEHSWLHVHHGEVEITQEGRTTPGPAGFLAHFDPHERREVRATQDSHLLLILAPWPGPGRDPDFNA
jgi:quercetin dioxygenase-like cupin family protein